MPYGAGTLLLLLQWNQKDAMPLFGFYAREILGGHEGLVLIKFIRIDHDIFGDTTSTLFIPQNYYYAKF